MIIVLCVSIFGLTRNSYVYWFIKFWLIAKKFLREDAWKIFASTKMTLAFHSMTGWEAWPKLAKLAFHAIQFLSSIKTLVNLAQVLNGLFSGPGSTPKNSWRSIHCKRHPAAALLAPNQLFYLFPFFISWFIFLL